MIYKCCCWGHCIVFHKHIYVFIFYFFNIIGAATLMQSENPHMVNMHCVAHCLAPCTFQAAANIPQLQSHQQVLTDLFYYFKVNEISNINYNF